MKKEIVLINGEALDKLLKDNHINRSKVCENAGFKSSYLKNCIRSGRMNAKMVNYLTFIGFNSEVYSIKTSEEKITKEERKGFHKPSYPIDSAKLEIEFKNRLGEDYMIKAANWLGFETQYLKRLLKNSVISKASIQRLDEKLSIRYEDYRPDEDLKENNDAAYSFEEAVLKSLNDISERLSKLESMWR